MTSEPLRRFVKERRSRLGASQLDLHRLSGVSLGWIGSLEAGRLKGPPRPSTLARLAKGLALDGEFPGTLTNFLTLAMADVLADETINAVARGETDTLAAMQAASRGEGLSTQGHKPIIPDQWARLDKVLAQIRGDLRGRDYLIAASVLEALYGA